MEASCGRRSHVHIVLCVRVAEREMRARVVVVDLSAFVCVARAHKHFPGLIILVRAHDVLSLSTLGYIYCAHIYKSGYAGRITASKSLQMCVCVCAGGFSSENTCQVAQSCGATYVLMINQCVTHTNTVAHYYLAGFSGTNLTRSQTLGHKSRRREYNRKMNTAPYILTSLRPVF